MISFKEYLLEGTLETITPAQFLRNIYEDPSWCKNITAPLMVNRKINISHSPITHLSPYLIFNYYAEFIKCPDLRVVTGKFKEGVLFSKCGVNKIQDFSAEVFDNTTPHSYSAQFLFCPNLAVAEGSYFGGVSFASSGVQKIGDLNLNNRNKVGAVANFTNCKKLEVATGTYPGAVNFEGSGVKEIKDLHITDTNGGGWSAGFERCRIQKISNFTYKGKIDADAETLKLIAEYEAEVAAEKMVGKAEGPIDGLF
jgi:hypothetical protein